MKRCVLIVLLSHLCLYMGATDTDSLFIHFLSWNNESPHAVTCSNFEHEMPFQTYIITSGIVIDSLSHQLQSLPPSEDADFQVGCKLYFIKSGAILKTVCLDSTHVLTQGKAYKNTPSVRNHLRELMEANQSVAHAPRFVPKNFGDEFVEGRDSLFCLLANRLNESLRGTDGPIKLQMTIYCKAERNGKTKAVRINVANRKTLSKSERKTVAALKRIISHEVIWNKDLERMNRDLIVFPFRFELRKECR